MTMLNIKCFIICAVYYYSFSLVNMLQNVKNLICVLAKSHPCPTITERSP